VSKRRGKQQQAASSAARAAGLQRSTCAHSEEAMAASAVTSGFPASPLTLLLLASLASGAGANYVIFSQRFSADPAPIVHDGRVYLYTSHDKDHNKGFDMSDYNCLSSSDMVNWRDEGIVFSMDNTTWAKDLHAWAQQVVELKNGTFVMFFPAMGNGGGVGVASATHPAGPFRQASASFLPGTAGADDPTIFIDGNGEAILCANGQLGCPKVPDGACPDCGVLADDMVSWKTPPAVLHSFNKSKWHYFEVCLLT
jgi:hypothetical protein